MISIFILAKRDHQVSYRLCMKVETFPQRGEIRKNNRERMRENSSERNYVHNERSNVIGIIPDGWGDGGSKEEEDILGKNIKKMAIEDVMQGKGCEEIMVVRTSDVLMEDVNALVLHETPKYQKQRTKGMVKNQFHIKAKLVGIEEEALNRTFDEQIAEWLKEKEEIASTVTEEQRSMLGLIPSLHISNKLKELYRPWKDALILIVLRKRANLHMMRDRVKWLLRLDKFEIIDLPNNYFIVKTSEIQLR